MEENIILKIFKDYWSQITLLIGVLGFFVKIIIDRIIRLHEIKIKSLHSEKVEAFKILYGVFMTYSTIIYQYKARLFLSYAEQSSFYEEINKIYSTFNSSVLHTQILLTEQKAEALRHMQKQLNDIYYKVATLDSEKKAEGFSSDHMLIMTDIDNFFEKELPTIKSKIEDLIRNEIGVKLK